MIERVSEKDHPYIVKRKFTCDVCGRIDYYSGRSFKLCLNRAFKYGWDICVDLCDFCPVCANNVEYYI